jgi:Asp-tRNA(Asn)/Glu-tRNA(Gln) amidotransferase A subunit family amidase
MLRHPDARRFAEVALNPYASIRELGRSLRARETTSVQLAEFYLARLADLGQKHHAVAQLTHGRAMEQAKAADKRFEIGAPIGPLDGIPFGVKDLLATKGIPTRWGSPGHDHQVFHYDATVVTKLQNAGGVLVAKLAMIELAGGGNYDIAGASATGACLCAFDNTRWAGGSSSGSGAATALGCVPYSLGSETAGSILCPSAFNGLTGFRATYGRTSRHGAMALAWSLDKVGPLCRSAEDAAIVLSTISGLDSNDPTTIPAKLNLSARGPKPRIGILKESFAKNKAQACEHAHAEAVGIFKRLGYEVIEVAWPDMPYDLAVGIIVDAEGASAHENFVRGPRFQEMADVNQVAGFAAALETKAVDYLWAMRFRQEALKANAVWEKCDAIFTPVFYHGAPKADEPLSKGFDNMGGDWGPCHLLGWPALAFPMGFEDHLPLGGQIMAPCYREDTCMRIVKDFQKATAWHKKRPA